MKLSNQEILDIVQKNDNSDHDRYCAVKCAEGQARDLTTTSTGKTIHYWSARDYGVFCGYVRRIVRLAHGSN